MIGLSKLSVVGLGDRFKHKIEYDAADYYLPADDHPDFGDDNNEPM